MGVPDLLQLAAPANATNSPTLVFVLTVTLADSRTETITCQPDLKIQANVTNLPNPAAANSATLANSLTLAKKFAFSLPRRTFEFCGLERFRVWWSFWRC